MTWVNEYALDHHPTHKDLFALKEVFTLIIINEYYKITIGSKTLMLELERLHVKQVLH